MSRIAALDLGKLNATGESGKIILPGRDRLDQLPLALKDAADLERGDGGQLDLPTPALSCLDPVAVPPEERLVGVKGLLTAPEGLLGLGDPVGSLHGKRMLGIGLEEPPQSGDPEADPVRRRDVIGVGTHEIR